MPKNSFSSRLHHTPEEKQVKMVCDVQILYQFIPIQACNSNSKITDSV